MSQPEDRSVELEQELDFVDRLNLEQLKYELAKELGPLDSNVEGLDGAPRIIPPQLQARIADDGMQAWLKVVHPGRPRAVGLDSIAAFLQSQGVVKGILVSNLELMLDKQVFDQEILVAEGRLPTHGTPGRIELRIARRNNPEDCVDARGRVDFKQMRLKNAVQRGEVVAIRVPATPGEPGFTVTGKELSCRPGKEAAFRLSVDVVPSETDPLQLVALKNGVLQRDFTIKDMNVIESDIDYSTGNIEYEKSLVIKGDVKSGFFVHSGGDVEILRCVEDAEVIATGDVIVKEGFLGVGKGLIRGRNVTVGHIKHQRVESEGDITVGGEVLYSILTSGGTIRVIGIKAIVIGGRLMAEKGIEAVNAGNAQGIRTHLCVGYNARVLEMDRQLERLRKYLEKVKGSVALFRAAGPAANLSEPKRKLLERLVLTTIRLEEEYAQLRQQREEYLGGLLQEVKPCIRVSGTVFSNTTIQIGDHKKFIEREQRSKMYVLHKNAILDLSASTLRRGDISDKD